MQDNQLNEPDDQAGAEAVDETTVGPEPVHTDDSPTFPPEHYRGALDPGTDDWVSDDDADRARRELPEPFERPDAVSAEDVDEITGGRPPLRLGGQDDDVDAVLRAEDDDGFDRSEPDVFATAELTDPADLSAEEAAIHLQR